MQINEEIISEVKRIAAAGYTPEQTAFRLGLDADEFMKALMNEEDPYCNCILPGIEQCGVSSKGVSLQISNCWKFASANTCH
jgi:hypothetical protein